MKGVYVAFLMAELLVYAKVVLKVDGWVFLMASKKVEAMVVSTVGLKAIGMASLLVAMWESSSGIQKVVS